MKEKYSLSMDLETIKKLLSSNDPNGIETALDALGEPGFPQALEMITPFLKHENKEVRSGAVFNLGEIRDERAVPFIIDYIKTEKNLIHRGFGIIALAAYKSRENLLFLKDLIEEGEILKKGNQFSRMNLAQQLGNYPEYEIALNLLKIFLHDENNKVRIMAVDSLRKFKGKEIKEIWEKIVESKDEIEYIHDLAREVLTRDYQ